MIVINHPARVIPGQEYFDKKTQMFFRTKDIHVPNIYLKLEHSLISMSKWESKWHKPFDPETMTSEELLDYVRCMNTNSSDQSDVYKFLSQKDINNILKYMNDPQTAWADPREKGKKKQIKKELKPVEEIYMAMVNLNLDPEFFGKWHINRLIALISYMDYTSSINNSGKARKPMSKKEEANIMAAYHELNQANRKKYNSKG